MLDEFKHEGSQTCVINAIKSSSFVFKFTTNDIDFIFFKIPGKEYKTVIKTDKEYKVIQKDTPTGSINESIFEIGQSISISTQENRNECFLSMPVTEAELTQKLKKSKIVTRKIKNFAEFKLKLHAEFGKIS